jgi:CDP-diacylglycerol--glycerol-3-phosphate 3-phosphatidyltransferase
VDAFANEGKSSRMANLITVARLILMFAVVALFTLGGSNVTAISMILIIVVFASDGVDGWVARKRNSTSAFGAVLDIVGDRIVENVLWVTFAVLGPIPLWVPLLVLTRGFIVDGLRSMSYADGMTAFGTNNMMRSPLTRWLTAGRFMRALFGYAKAAGFVFLVGYWGSQQPDAPGTWVETLHDFIPYLVIGWGTVWLSVALTIIRGLPVIFDAWDMIIASSRGSRTAPLSSPPTAEPGVVSTAADDRT